jgi:hypothetical protein
MAVPGLMQGGRIVEVPVGDRTVANKFYVIYEFPPGSNQYVSYQFDSFDQLKQTVGVRKASGALAAPVDIRSQSWMDQNVLTTGGNIAEVIGKPTESWASHMSDVQKEAARRAGVRDPALIGEMWSNKEMQQIAAQAVVGNWTPEQIVAEQRKTSYWQETLYPGIKNFYGQTANPEQAWTQYVSNVSGALTDLGYERDADGTYNSTIKKMLNRKVDDRTFVSQAPIFQRAQQNDQYRQILSQRAGRNISFDEWFKVLQGTAPSDLQRIANEAGIAFQAQQQGFDLSEQQLQTLQQAEIDEGRAAQTFTEVTQAVLALGDIGLQRGELTRDEILSASAGIAPESGRSPTEVLNLVGKLAREEGLFDDEKINMFVQFGAGGRFDRPALQTLKPERG